MTDWLSDAVFYEIYPQSFADSDGDGIGDLPGALSHLDHLAALGVDAVWFNPCFASPFRDAGYDVSDYLRIAPRYGTNDDMVAFVEAARERGIRVVLDLVAGHTSTEHEWFRRSAASTGPEPGGDRYIWSDRPGPGFVPSPGPRPGYYLRNFYESQPAINFGYARTDPDEPWREPVDAPGPRQNRAALREIIAFWLDRGVSGFRVDMAFSLVKDDPDFAATAALWREIADWMHEAYPDAILLPESDNTAPVDIGVRGGFDADFFLVIHAAHSALFNNGGAGTLSWLPDHERCYFDESGQGAADLDRFLEIWRTHHEVAGAGRLVVLGSADHDYSRLATGTRTREQLGAAYAFLLTWGTVPAIYYGDEIGMRYLPGLPDKEGSIYDPAYNRSGCRSPMQWDDARPNAGFSTAPAGELYLPQDPDPDRPTVAAQLGDPDSPLERLRRLIRLRRETPALRTAAATTVLAGGYPLVYLRGDDHMVVINPAREPRSVALAGADAAPLEASG
ncbi:MAG TPA: alpha-amylase family glycosyl hydrolase, partial [Mycobacteriales bacterium]|nr:alpha-amylase family glycosyl hydrolase [Mycobacteriales bacterium]